MKAGNGGLPAKMPPEPAIFRKHFIRVIMKKYLSTLLIVAALGGSSATASVLARPAAMQMQQLTDTQLNRLFTKASNVWGIPVNALWADYQDGLLTVTPEGGNYYVLVHVDGGNILAELEDGSF
jgi:hypothetical protein